MTTKRPRYQPKGKLLTSSVMASMRDTTFGMATRVSTFKTMDKSEKMRDDDTLIAQAEAKRKRKNEKRKEMQSK